MICTETTRLTLSPYEKDRPDVQCMREVNENGLHIGQHQGITHNPPRPPDPSSPFDRLREGIPATDSLVTWSDGGAQSHRYSPDEPSANCSCRQPRNRTGHQPEDHRWANCATCGCVFDSKGATQCFNCGYWQVRIDGYNKVGKKGERFVRADNDSYAHVPWLYVWSPGHGGAFGGRQFLVEWHDGTKDGPADFLWSNGRIPWWLIDQFPPNARITAAEKIDRPGYTDRFGTPLTYTAHPGNL